MYLILLFLGVSYDAVNALSGKATMYGGADTGNACGYNGVPSSSFPYSYYAACGSSTFDSGKGCGKCFKVTCVGPYGNNPSCQCDPDTPSVVVSCMDQCPECAASHLDLTTNSMERIVADGLAGTCGVITTTYERVDCGYTGNIKIRSKSGTSGFWYGLHIDDVAGSGSINKVQLKPTGKSWGSYSCAKSTGPSFWLCDLSAGKPLVAPVSVRLTNDYGETVECDGCITNLNGNQEFDFGTNYGGGSSSSSSSGSSGSSSSGSSGSSSSGSSSSSSSSSSGNWIITNRDGINKWYYSLLIENIADCVPSTTNVQLYLNNQWVSADDMWASGTNANGYAWNYKGTTYNSILPISLRVVTADGTARTLWGVVKDINEGSTFSTGKSCSSLASPFGSIPSSPATPTDTVLSFTAQDLVIIGLAVININVIVIALYFCCGRKETEAKKYERVKMMTDTEDDEQAYLA